MKILFLCTAHNSLSQRLYLDLTAAGHVISIEYALSDQIMIDAANIFCPHLIVCPFLTVRVPRQIYHQYMTLIIHPGPPGDAGPSSIDWVIMGDDGSIDNSMQLLKNLDDEKGLCPGRSHWGVTVLQAMEDFDSGPVWAFEQFSLDIDQQGLTKSSLYRGPITAAAITATRAAISRLQIAQRLSFPIDFSVGFSFAPSLQAEDSYSMLSVTDNMSFQGGKVHARPLLKAISRDFDLTRHSAKQISRRIRSADSQPGARSAIFGIALFLYGGVVEEITSGRPAIMLPGTSTNIIGIRNDAVCIKASDDRGVWITHVRRLKGNNTALWPKVPALPCLLELGVITPVVLTALEWPLHLDFSLSTATTFRELWVDIKIDETHKRIAYLHFDFYNGAMSTNQCTRLINAMDYILGQSSSGDPVHAVVLMGGGYFSNGINLTVIEAAKDSAMESWLNINQMNDAVQKLICDFPARNILTIAAIRGNAAAGGLALATACDWVIAGAEVVLNPAYRGIGLFGSEYHTLSYVGRCGEEMSRKVLRDMQPLSPVQARKIGLVDFVFPGTGQVLDDHICYHISFMLRAECLNRGIWKARIDCSPPAMAYTRALELGEMAKDFWSARSTRYHSRRHAFVRKIKPVKTPTRFAVHRRLDENNHIDEEETDEFDDVKYFESLAEQNLLSRQETQTKIVTESIGDECQEVGHGTLSRIKGFLTPADRILSVSPRANDAVILFQCYYDPIEQLPTPPASPKQALLSRESSAPTTLDSATDLLGMMDRDAELA